MAVSASLEKGLAALGLDPPSARVLALLPLVYVAWADGVIQDAERQLIDDQARLLAPTPDGALVLKNWLTYPPSPRLLGRGHEALMALFAESGPDRPAPKAIVAYCRRVAAAAGGVLGVGATSRAEQRAISTIAQVLRVTASRRVDLVRMSSPGTEQVPRAPNRKPVVTFHTTETPGARSSGVLIGENGERCPIGRDGVTLGRGPDNDVQVNCDGKVSRQHCRLQLRRGNFYVTDLGSARGTYVDGDRVLERRLFGGELVRIGSSTFRFERLLAMVVTD